MSAASARLIRQRLEKSLGDSIDCALGLRDILLQEQSALAQQDLHQLATTTALKEACVAKLASLEHVRQRIGVDAGLGVASADMPAVIDGCDKDSRIADRWRHFQQISRQCDALNLTNGAIIRLRRQHALTSLAVLRGDTRSNETYGNTRSRPGGLAGRELAEI